MEDSVSGRLTINFTIMLDSSNVNLSLDAEGEFFDIVGAFLKKEDFEVIVQDLVGRIAMWMNEATKSMEKFH